ncbi:MAG: cell division protein ZapE [Betaproteobacteria bacterium]
MDPAAPVAIGPREGRLIAWLDPILAARGTTLDHSQAAALDRLQELSSELEAFRAARRSTLSKLFSPPDIPRGVYLWGGVGRGKSFLMDAFYATVEIRRKTRVHFHAFMREVHEGLAELKSESDPLATVAERIARKWRLICFDEFHVSDIADAMILGRLLSALFGRGVVFVMTTNYPPDGLWPNGLQRERFLPTIALLKEWLDVVQVDAGIDYRLRALEKVESYHVPVDARAEGALAAAFETMRSGPNEDPRLAIEGRTLLARQRAGSAVWFDFATLCDGPRSQRDYLELARRFSVVLLSGIPQMTVDMGDRARRFTWLVDILYDQRVKLLASAAARPEDLYREGPGSREFVRTVSRLAEMQTHDYMGEPHIAAEMPSTD